MATTSERLLDLLSLLGARAQWSGADLSERLGVSPRTVRRDVESLRKLGYPVRTVKGPEGGYRLGAGGKLPPLLLVCATGGSSRHRPSPRPRCGPSAPPCVPDTSCVSMSSTPTGAGPRQCSGSATIDLPPGLVARWAPGGSVVEYVSPRQTRITVGAWSWAGVAGILASFDADVTGVEPAELVAACRTLARRYDRVTAG